MIRREATALIVIDLQDGLLPKILSAETIIGQTVRLIRFARELDVPMLWTEQYPKGLGPTTESVARELPDIEPLAKTAFGCFGDSPFVDALKAVNRTQLMLVGIESHVCVMQTALAALEQNYEVYVVRDAVGSQTDSDYRAGLERMQRAGAELVTSQMAMFEMLREAGTPEFKRVLPLLK